jgi:glutamyl-tRNA reductase
LRARGHSDQLLAADLIVTCLEGVPNLITREVFDRRRLKQRDRPVLALDLSVPRAIEPRVGELDNLLLYDMDDLAAVVERNQSDRQRALEETSGILVAEVHKYLALRSYAAVAPSLSGLRTRFETLREVVLDEVVGARSSPEQMRLAHELTRRLLDAALAEVKESFRKARSEEELEREYRRYMEGL